MLFNAVQNAFMSQMLPNIKNHNPSIYKQPFYNFVSTFSYFLNQIAIPSVCCQLSSIPNLQQCAEHHHIPQQSVHKQQHCNISHFSRTFTLLSLALIVLCRLNFMEFCEPYL